jgi:general secretion pathway protein G
MIGSVKDRRESGRPRSGFTLVELLMVVVVLAILVALLLPAINAAVRTARQAAVQAEINQIATALESFKAKYGDYPPSRILLVESGDYTAFMGNASLSAGPIDPTSPGVGDITSGQLAQRSVAALRRFFPRVKLSTSGGVAQGWYDFNGNNNNPLQNPEAYVLHGHECLVFFLGGVPLVDPKTGAISMTGFGKDPTNPFTNSVVGSAAYNANRDPAIFEFNAGRLALDPSGTSGIPGYYDSLGNAPPVPGAPSTTLNFYAYFSAYGNGAYDPNDVNFGNELDERGGGPIGLAFALGCATTLTPPAPPPPGLPNCGSPSPNPYTSTLTANNAAGAALPNGTVSYQKPQTYQIVSAGVDGLYGLGGQFISGTQRASTATNVLPFDKDNSFVGTLATAELDETVRQRERDNLTNFKSGTLQ